MSTFIKFVFRLLGALVLLTLLGGLAAVLILRFTAAGVGRAAAATRDDVPAVAAQIATVQVPAGFKPDYTFSAAGYTVAAYKGSDDHSHLILAHGPKDLDLNSEELKKTAEQQSGSRYAQITPVGSFEVSINGQSATVQVGEGINGDHEVYRQAYVAFQGKNGPTLVQITRPASAWDEGEVREFFSSID